MRTTIHLPDELLERARQAATDSNRTMTAFIEEAVHAALSRRARQTARRPELPTFGEGGLQAGIDLDDSAALLGAMEDADAAD